MTTLHKASKQALDAIETHGGHLPFLVYQYLRGALRHAIQPCNWWEEDGAWTTGCARRFVLEAGTPSDNSMAYCCYCGSVIKEVEA